MAKFILGSIITDIAGSVGGTTLRRTQQGHVMYNKQGRQIKSGFKPNNRRVQLASLFQQYSFLTPTEKAKWNEQAQLFSFPDKFGIYRQISGRLLYIKLNGALLASGSSANVKQLSNKLPEVRVTGFINDYSNSIFTVIFDKPVTDSIVYISVFQINQGVELVSSKRVAPIFVAVLQNFTSVDIFNELSQNLPVLDVGKKIAVNVSILNVSGFSQPVQAFTLVLE